MKAHNLSTWEAEAEVLRFCFDTFTAAILRWDRDIDFPPPPRLRVPCQRNGSTTRLSLPTTFRIRCSIVDRRRRRRFVPIFLALSAWHMLAAQQLLCGAARPSSSSQSSRIMMNPDLKSRCRSIIYCFHQHCVLGRGGHIPLQIQSILWQNQTSCYNEEGRVQTTQ